jgi:hypothetical protein
VSATRSAPPEQASVPNADKIRHEDFCLPRPGLDEPRIESYPYLGDDPETGRSRPVAQVTRCMECGAAHYARQEN